ncbi:MAG: START domain-containing protein [Bacteroidia bacterium]
MKLLLIITVLFFFLPSGNDWIEKLNKNGVIVYVKTSENSKIKSTKSVVTINASPGKVKSILLDIAKYPDWVYKCTKTELVNKVKDKEIYYYQYIKAPFTISDRDMALLLKISDVADEIMITIKAQPYKIPKKDGVVRIELFDSIWILKKVKDKTEVANEITTDPGGSIPAWLVNSVITSGAYNTMLRLKQIAEQN